MKTCCDCNQTLPLKSFVSKASCKDGYEPRCRNCRSIKYNKSTPALFCKKIYATQKTHSVTRGHPAPQYSQEDLLLWLQSQPMFLDMYSAWQDAGYPKELAPSVDRIDDSIPYQLNNLQLMTWGANRAKAAADKKTSTLLVNHRPVAAYLPNGDLYKRYSSMAEAMREFGGKATQSWGISSVCNGVPVKDGRGKMYTPKTYKGYLWKWDD